MKSKQKQSNKGKKIFTCNECGRTFIDKQRLKFHQKNFRYKHKESKGNLYINWDEGRWGVTLPNGYDSQIGGRIEYRDIGRSVEFDGPINLKFMGKVKLIRDLIGVIINL